MPAMKQNFVVIECGIPSVEEELKPQTPNRLGAMKGNWINYKAFDGVSRYELKPKENFSFSILQRLLAHTVYNPSTNVQLEWHVTGASSLSEIMEVEKGLEIDDDIIQQWFQADEVLKLLRSASTFEEMVDRVRCVCGEYETDKRLENLVENIIGKVEE